MPDTIFHGSMGQGIMCWCFYGFCWDFFCLFVEVIVVFFGGDNPAFLGMEEMESILSL